jgi:dihydroneopterin aldolase
VQIFIRALTFEAIIGLLPQERLHPQCVVFDGFFTCKDTPLEIDYSVVAAHIKAEIIAQKFDTVEAALLHLASMLKSTFPQIQGLDITLSKPDILPDCTVGARLEKIY